MGSIRRDIHLDADPATVWDAIRDVGAPHRRLATGFVTDTTLDGPVRTVTFANGDVVRELVVDVDDERRRLAYAVVGGRFAHHHATMEVLDAADGSARLLWVSDVAPDETAPIVEELVDLGVEAMQRTLRGAGR